MANIIHILPSISIVIPGDGPVTLDNLQSFIDQARGMGVPIDKELSIALKAPFDYDQREGREPGSFTIQAMP